MSDRWWFCLDHKAVEPEDGCKNATRLGPFATKDEAARALRDSRRTYRGVGRRRQGVGRTELRAERGQGWRDRPVDIGRAARRADPGPAPPAGRPRRSSLSMVVMPSASVPASTTDTRLSSRPVIATPLPVIPTRLAILSPPPRERSQSGPGQRRRGTARPTARRSCADTPNTSASAAATEVLAGRIRCSTPSARRGSARSALTSSGRVSRGRGPGSRGSRLRDPVSPVLVMTYVLSALRQSTSLDSSRPPAVSTVPASIAPCGCPP